MTHHFGDRPERPGSLFEKPEPVPASRAPTKTPRHTGRHGLGRGRGCRRRRDGRPTRGRREPRRSRPRCAGERQPRARRRRHAPEGRRADRRRRPRHAWGTAARRRRDARRRVSPSADAPGAEGQPRRRQRLARDGGPPRRRPRHARDSGPPRRRRARRAEDRRRVPGVSPLIRPRPPWNRAAADPFATAPMPATRPAADRLSARPSPPNRPPSTGSPPPSPRATGPPLGPGRRFRWTSRAVTTSPRPTSAQRQPGTRSSTTRRPRRCR